MSEDPRRICVCGRQRSKEPVIITITTCKNNHGITTDGATVCVTSVSPQPESSTDQPVVGKPITNEPTNPPPPSSNENTQSTPEVQAGSDAITEDTALPAESNQIETIEEVNPTEEEGEVANDTDADIAAENETDAPTEENPTTADIQEEGNPEEVDESTEQENAEIQIEDEGLEPAIATDEGNIDVEPSVEETNLDTNDGIDEDNPEEFVQSVSDQELQESQPEAVS